MLLKNEPDVSRQFSNNTVPNPTLLIDYTGKKIKSELRSAVISGNHEEVARLSNTGSTYKEIEIEEAFLLASYHGHHTIVGSFLKWSTDLIRSVDASGNTALHLACKRGHTAVVKMIMEFIEKKSLKPLLAAGNKQFQNCFSLAYLHHKELYQMLLDYYTNNVDNFRYIYIATLLRCFSYTQEVEVLDLSPLKLTNIEFESVIFRYFLQVRSIKQIDLSNCLLTDSISERLVAYCNEKKISTINLSGNPLGKGQLISSIGNLMKALRKNNKTITSLSLMSSNIVVKNSFVQTV